MLSGHQCGWGGPALGELLTEFLTFMICESVKTRKQMIIVVSPGVGAGHLAWSPVVDRTLVRKLLIRDCGMVSAIGNARRVYNGTWGGIAWGSGRGGRWGAQADDCKIVGVLNAPRKWGLGDGVSLGTLIDGCVWSVVCGYHGRY